MTNIFVTDLGKTPFIDWSGRAFHPCEDWAGRSNMSLSLSVGIGGHY